VKSHTYVVCVIERSASRRTSSLTVANIQDTCRSRAASAAPSRHRLQRHTLSDSRLRPTYAVMPSLSTVLELPLHDDFTLQHPKSLDSAIFSLFALFSMMLAELYASLLTSLEACIQEASLLT